MMDWVRQSQSIKTKDQFKILNRNIKEKQIK